MSECETRFLDRKEASQSAKCDENVRNSLFSSEHNDGRREKNGDDLSTTDLRERAPHIQLFRRRCQPISAQPGDRNASWMSARLSKRTRSRRNSRRAKWIRSHTPACCRRASAASRSSLTLPRVPAAASAAIPLRRTKTMPLRHARSGMRGRPPFGRGGELGRNSSTRSHNASGSSAAAITATLRAIPR